MKCLRSNSFLSLCASCYSGKSVRGKLNYNRIRHGLKRSIPAAIVLWAFHKIPSKEGLTSRRVIGFLKRHYKVADNPQRTGKSISKMLRCAVEFGLLKKRGNRYFLTK